MHQECHEAPPLENDLTHIANLQSRSCRYLSSYGSLLSSLFPLSPFSFRQSPLPLTVPYTLVDCFLSGSVDGADTGRPSRQWPRPEGGDRHLGRSMLVHREARAQHCSRGSWTLHTRTAAGVVGRSCRQVGTAGYHRRGSRSKTPPGGCSWAGGTGGARAGMAEEDGRSRHREGAAGRAERGEPAPGRHGKSAAAAAGNAERGFITRVVGRRTLKF